MVTTNEPERSFRNLHRILLINFLFLLALCLPLGGKTEAAETNQKPALLSGAKPPVKNTTHTDGRGTLKLFFPPHGQVTAVKGRQAADTFLKAHQGDFKLPAGITNLELISARESLLGTHYRYRQVLNGLPVEGADLVVSISRDGGEVYQAYNNTYPVEAAPVFPKTLIGDSGALDAAWNHLRVRGKLLDRPRAELVYVPAKGGFRLVYKTLVAVEAPFGYWEHQIDAVSGAVVAVRDTVIRENKQAGQLPDFSAYTGPVWPREQTTQEWEAASVLQKQAAEANKNTVNGTALVFDGDPRTYLADASLVDSSPASAFTAAYVTRVLRDISEAGGVYSLVGPWVQIVDFETPSTAPSTTANGQWTALRGNNAFNDAMTYFHIDQSQRYLQSLGYSNVTGIQYGPIQADSDGLSGADNSHYIPANNRLAFGHGGVDDNEDADVILHEYGHAITHGIVPTWGGGDGGAIGEGYGDYWGASYSSRTVNGQTFHPEWAFSWDGHSADSWPGRWLDKTNLTYNPTHTYVAHETWQGVPNGSDQLWSAPLWQSFLTLAGLGYPRTDMDKIVTESYFGVGGSPTMRDMANATVNAATSLFPSGPHAGVFREKFQNQAILPPPALPDPLFVFPVGGETFTTGAVVQVQWNQQGAPAVAAARLEYSAGSLTTFSDNMESGINGWAVSHARGSLNWSQVTTASHTPTHSWFATDQTIVSDQFLRSPLIMVSAGAELSFWHSYNLESDVNGQYDGGVVEISTNGTTWVDLGITSTQNGYNSTISTLYSSPIGGRRAFSGSSGGFIETRIPLAAYAGKSVYIRFREANDSSAAATGWWVDDVSVVQQWVAIGTTPANAASYLWTLPTTPGTNYMLRIQQFAAGYGDSAWVQSALFTITTNAANNPPTLDIITSRTINEDAATTNITLTGIGPGPDSGQTVTNITATSDNLGLISNPAVSYTSGNTTGTLSLAPLANATGSATITVIVKDNGGTANGGVNSKTNTFLVTVNPANDAPTLDSIANLAINEDAAMTNITLTGIGPGPDSGQTVTNITATSSNLGLIPNPTVSYASGNTTGTLSIAPVANANGTATITLIVKDNGGTANSGVNSKTNTFLVTVNPVNDAPTLDSIAKLAINEDSAMTNITLTGIGPGPDSGQTVTNITAASSNPGLIPNPTVSYTDGNNTGSLSLAPLTNATGSATITVIVKDNGGTANGGVNSKTNTFNMTVIPLPEVLTVSGILANPDGNVSVTFGGGRPGSNYVVQATTNLAPTVWSNLATNIAGLGGQWTFDDLKATNFDSRFYRSAKP